MQCQFVTFMIRSLEDDFRESGGCEEGWFRECWVCEDIVGSEQGMCYPAIYVAC